MLFSKAVPPGLTNFQVIMKVCRIRQPQMLSHFLPIESIKLMAIFRQARPQAYPISSGPPRTRTLPPYSENGHYWIGLSSSIDYSFLAPSSRTYDTGTGLNLVEGSVLHPPWREYIQPSSILRVKAAWMQLNQNWRHNQAGSLLVRSTRMPLFWSCL